MLNRKFTALTAAALMAVAGASHAADDDRGRIEIGYLECDMTASSNAIIISEQEFICTFDPAEEGFLNETYIADVSKFGIDLSSTREEKIRWGVFAPAEKFENGVLEGEYAGVSADIALGAGIGGKALVGGFKDSIALQPLSVTTQEGVGVAVGIENLTLKFVSDKS